jgi:ribonuclease HI
MNDFKEFVESIYKQKTTIEERINKEGMPLLKKVFKDFFHKHPEAKAVMWYQCTYRWFSDDPDSGWPFTVYRPKLHVHLEQMEPDIKTITEWVSMHHKNPHPCFIETIKFLTWDDRVTPCGDKETYRQDIRASAGVSLRSMTAQEQELVSDFEALKELLERSADAVLRECLGESAYVYATPDGFEVSDEEEELSYE